MNNSEIDKLRLLAGIKGVRPIGETQINENYSNDTTNAVALILKNHSKKVYDIFYNKINQKGITVEEFEETITNPIEHYINRIPMDHIGMIIQHFVSNALNEVNWQEIYDDFKEE